MYRSTQRNQLGVAKGVTNESKRSSRLNWIDLFNIGNVMLMRGQDIQVAHSGSSEICELDDFVQLPNFEEISVSNSKMGNGQSMAQSEIGSGLPDLCLKKCNNYNIAKDTFTELVLLTVIAYFCVSTEQRFINMNTEKEKN